jgi:hypothetical protein
MKVKNEKSKTVFGFEALPFGKCFLFGADENGNARN